MYSLRVQLFLFVLIAAAGGIYAVAGDHPSLLSIIILIASVLLSYILLLLFVYRPLQRIRRTVNITDDADPFRRAIVSSSDEFQQLSDALNELTDTFRTDMREREKLERIRSEFLSNVSHELRTPLFTAQGLIETLLHGAVDDKKVNRDFLKKALHHTERLNSLLEELIDISRIESGEMKLRLRFFDLAEVVRTVVEELQTYAEQRSITLTASVTAEQTLEAFGDKERLQRVLVNLIENGIKYSEKGDTVSVSLKEAVSIVSVSVTDTGIGIAPQHLPRIFERFYRVDKDRSRDVGGSGLGLAIVKHIVEAHKQTITVESEVGIGTTFTFTVGRTGADG